MIYKQQEKALGKLQVWIGINSPIFALSGYSGTGKSHVIAKLIAWYQSRYPANLIAVLAPSHKAKKNLESMIVSTKNVDTNTISSFLGLVPKLDESTGKVEFKAVQVDKVVVTIPDDYDLVIVDEYSMITKEQVLTLNNKCHKLIYVGDPAQLPPIGESKSHVCELDCPSYQLTDVVRYSGDLARVAESWRDAAAIKSANGVTIKLVSLSSPTPIITVPDGSIKSLPKIRWIEQCSNDIKAFVENNADEMSQLVTFTNKAAEKWNRWIRAEIWGDAIESYNIGDRLICKKPLFRPNQATGKLSIKVANSSEFTVHSRPTARSLIIAGQRYHYDVVPVKAENGDPFELFVLDTDSGYLRDKELKRISYDAKNCRINSHRSSLWQSFYLLQQTFDDVAFAYAITAHKSQGSTYPAVYLDLLDLQKCSDLKRIIYTALTRSKQVYVYE